MDLRETDEAILDVLQNGRATAPYIEVRTEYSREYIRQRLGALTDAGVIERIGTGLYELKEDPRDDE